MHSQTEQRSLLGAGISAQTTVGEKAVMRRHDAGEQPGHHNENCTETRNTLNQQLGEPHEGKPPLSARLVPDAGGGYQQQQHRGCHAINIAMLKPYQEYLF